MTGKTETFPHTKGGPTPYCAFNTLDFKCVMKPEMAFGDTVLNVVTSSATAFLQCHRCHL